MKNALVIITAVALLIAIAINRSLESYRICSPIGCETYYYLNWPHWS